jgi:hypothetical protein
LAPPCGGAWQDSVREFLFDKEQGYLQVLDKIVHTEYGAVLLVCTSKWGHSEVNFQNNPRSRSQRPQQAKNFKLTLRSSIVRPVIGHLDEHRRALLLPLEAIDRENVVNY